MSKNKMYQDGYQHAKANRKRQVLDSPSYNEGYAKGLKERILLGKPVNNMTD